jgi:DNA-binding GntR family transcriptional regulator
LAIEVDRASPVPLYFQVATQIERAIEDGSLAAGSRLENEVELADRLGLSRPTLRRAIQELVAKGLLVRKRGVGTQVVQGAGFRRAVDLTSLYDDLARTQQSPSTKVCVHELVAAEEDVATVLGLASGADVVHVERVRYARAKPLAILRNWLPPDIAQFSTAELETRGLYALLRSANVHLRIASQRIGAAGATAAESRLLELRKSSPLLTMERTTWDDSGRVVELGRHVYVPDSYSFEVTVVGR